MKLRYLLAQWSGKLVFKFLRLLGHGATTLPGLVATKIEPRFVEIAAKKLAVVVITGTNGKTTTANQLADIFKLAGWKYIHNASGSNLLRGVATALLEAKGKNWAIVEADEAAFGEIVKQTNPKAVLITNLFRDQMDRYGEIDKTARLWQTALKGLNSQTTVILNADDPTLARLGKSLSKVVYFGINDRSVGSEKLTHTADSILSPSNYSKLVYERVFYSHLGIYHDEGSDWQRPPLDCEINNIQLRSFDGADFIIKNSEELEIKTKMPGVFNVYNITGAVVMAKELGIKNEIIEKATSEFKPAFGRFEKVELPNGKKLVLFLIKNPVGFDQIISLLNLTESKKEIIIGINDRFADGQDVSWLWDANLEELVGGAEEVTCCGTRANDMALRLKYAGLGSEEILVNKDFIKLLSDLQSMKAEEIYCLLTYTTMLEFREILVKNGLVRPFYEEK